MNVIPYNLVRTSRKTIALVITPNAELLVRAPEKASVEDIEKCIVKKSNWIKEKQASVATFDEKHAIVDMKQGDVVIYLGEDYIIDYKSAGDIEIDGRIIWIPHVADSKQLLLKWLKAQAQLIISERVEFFSQHIGANYKAINLTEAKARWGSCGVNGNLNFAWRLVMCPLQVIDYVVVHELSHLTYKNHDRSFWMRVKTILPNYKEQQAWMTLNRKLMDVI